MNFFKRKMFTIMLFAVMAVSSSAVTSLSASAVSASEELAVTTESFILLEREPLIVGYEIEVLAQASGGIVGDQDEYRYQFEYYPVRSDSRWCILQSFSQSKTISFAFYEAGKYYFRITVKDAGGYTASSNYILHVYDGNINTTTLSAEGIVLGETLTIHPSFETDIPDNNDGYFYYRYKKEGDTEWTENYTQTLDDIPIQFSEDGLYSLEATPYLSYGDMQKKTFFITVSDNLSCSIEGKNKLSSVRQGDKLTLNTSAVGGHYAKADNKQFTYEYQWRYAGEEIWHPVGQKSTTPTDTLTADWNDDVELMVTVTDEAGHTASDTVYCRKATDVLQNLSVMASESITLGQSVQITAQASGGTGHYTYGVYYKKSASEKWSTAQSYSTNKTVIFKPAAAVKYDVCVKVKDSSGKIVKQYFSVSVKKNLTNTSTMSTTTVKKGGTVTATAKASGGTGKYTYGVYYKKATSEKWSTAQSYSTNKTVTIKPAAAVKYDVCIKVKDSSGKIVKKYFVITCL